jgi:spore germination protein GerM
MPTITPKDYVAPVIAEKAARDTKPVKDAIKALVKAPKDYGDVVAAIKAQEKAAGRYWTTSELAVVVAEVDAEWNGAKISDEPVMEEK